MPTIFVRGILFVSSYFPLLLIFCILLFNKYPIWAISSLALGLSSLILG